MLLLKVSLSQGPEIWYVLLSHKNPTPIFFLHVLLFMRLYVIKIATFHTQKKSMQMGEGVGTLALCKAPGFAMRRYELSGHSRPNLYL